jgi:tetratricopeptide (TPR) repeat protein
VQIAQAVAAAHDAGVIHRDLKPENVMIRADGYVKVLDFGLAKLTGPEAFGGDDVHATALVETRGGVVMGTFNYMAPEQARGSDVDGRADLFALGVLLYEMLAGQPPFKGATAADVVGAILFRDPEPLAHEDVPDELERIVRTALQKERDERYQTCAEIVRDLRAVARTLDTEGSGEFVRISEYQAQTAGVMPSALADAGSASAEVQQALASRRRRSRRVESLAVYLRGRYFLNNRTGDALKNARTLFERAVAEDPGYALAHAGLADCCSLIAVSLRTASSGGLIEHARAAALTALTLDESLADGHASLAFIKFRFEWDWTGAESEFTRALDLNPGHAPSRQWYAMFLASRARFDEALDQMTRALELDPLSLIIHSGIGRILHFAGRLDEATTQFEHVLQTNPGFAQAHIDLALTRMARGELAAARPSSRARPSSSAKCRRSYCSTPAARCARGVSTMPGPPSATCGNAMSAAPPERTISPCWRRSSASGGRRSTADGCVRPTSAVSRLHRRRARHGPAAARH